MYRGPQDVGYKELVGDSKVRGKVGWFISKNVPDEFY